MDLSTEHYVDEFDLIRAGLLSSSRCASCVNRNSVRIANASALALLIVIFFNMKHNVAQLSGIYMDRRTSKAFQEFKLTMNCFAFAESVPFSDLQNTCAHSLYFVSISSDLVALRKNMHFLIKLSANAVLAPFGATHSLTCHLRGVCLASICILSE